LRKLESSREVVQVDIVTNFGRKEKNKVYEGKGDYKKNVIGPSLSST